MCYILKWNANYYIVWYSDAFNCPRGALLNQQNIGKCDIFHVLYFTEKLFTLVEENSNGIYVSKQNNALKAYSWLIKKRRFYFTNCCFKNSDLSLRFNLLISNCKQSTMVEENATVALPRILETKQKTNKELKIIKRKYSTVA